MVSKLAEKERAIELRKQGLTYREILELVPVAKSTLSEWLKSQSLARSLQIRITQKRIEAARRGGLKRKVQRLELSRQIKEEAGKEVPHLGTKDLWLVGTCLYWAEGSKSKEYSPSCGLIMSNSDPKMIRVFLAWCRKCLKVSDKNISIDLYIHETKKDQIEKVKDFWSVQTGLPKDKFDKIYFKRNPLHPRRRNTGNDYNGLLRIIIKRSTNLNRRISAWIEGIANQCGVG